MRASLRHVVLVAGLASIAALTMSSCSAATVTPPQPSTTTAGETATPSPTPTPTTIPLDIECDDLVPAQTMYDFNANFVLTTEFTPEPGSRAVAVLDAGGVACQWVNGTTDENIVIAVAELPAAELDALKNELIVTSNPVPTYGDEGYFQVRDGRGEAEAFSGPNWIVGLSTEFLEPGDAAPLIESAIAALN